MTKYTTQKKISKQYFSQNSQKKPYYFVNIILLVSTTLPSAMRE